MFSMKPLVLTNQHISWYPKHILDLPNYKYNVFCQIKCQYIENMTLPDKIFDWKYRLTEFGDSIINWIHNIDLDKLNSIINSTF